MRRFRPIPLLGVLLCMAAAPIAVQAGGSGSLTGKVVTPDGRALNGVLVALYKPEDRGAIASLAQSNQQGTYSLTGVPPGSYALRVSRNGYQVISTPRVTINPGKTTTLNFVLQELLDFISAPNDPRNWDLKTVMRSASARRLIFRDLPGAPTGERPFESSRPIGALNVAASALLGGDSFVSSPNDSNTGIISNFAFIEPMTPHGRMLFSGQLASGNDSVWRVRNTFQFSPNETQDWKFSLGYGRQNINHMGAATVAQPTEFFAMDPTLRDSGVETLALGVQVTSKLSDIMAVGYGLDLSRINYGGTSEMWSPYFQLTITPHRRWLFRTLMTSQRVSDNNSVELPGGEVVNLMEPAYITGNRNDIHISQVRHAELSVARKVTDDTSLEVTVYRDRVDGLGTPFLVTVQSAGNKTTYATQLRRDQDAQQGLRVAAARTIIDVIRGSITYDYGTAASLASPDTLLSRDLMTERLLDFVRHSYYHSVSSQLEAAIRRTRTHMQATYRWYPGNPISPIDPFADRSDTVAKGMSFSVRQVIPLPEFFGNSGRWEAMVDIRNPLNEGMNRIYATDGVLTLTRNPRTLRFGLNLNFF